MHVHINVLKDLSACKSYRCFVKHSPRVNASETAQYPQKKLPNVLDLNMGFNKCRIPLLGTSFKLAQFNVKMTDHNDNKTSTNTLQEQWFEKMFICDSFPI